MTRAERAAILACIGAMERQCAELRAMLAADEDERDPPCRAFAKCGEHLCAKPTGHDGEHECDGYEPDESETAQAAALAAHERSGEAAVPWEEARARALSSCAGTCCDCDKRPCDRPQHDDAAHVCDACTPF